MTQRFVIIGTGVAGIAAAQAIRQKLPQASITLIGNEPDLYYSRPGLAYYLTKELPETGLFPIQRDELKKLNIGIVHGRAAQIDPDAHRIQLANGQNLPYDRLLIATGASAAWPKLPGNDLEGVVKLDNLPDTRHIIKLARKARSAVVIGGGITALEIVEGLAARKVSVHYFLRRARYWSNVLDEEESHIIEDRLREEGVQIHYHTEATQIIGKRGRVVGVLTQDGRKIPCQIVAIAVGIRPRIELAAAIGLRVERGILVNQFLQTSQPDIYTAGDVAQVFDPLTGRYNIDSLWGPARQQGHIAGLNMAGGQILYQKSAPFNVTRLAGLTTTIIGAVGSGEDDDLIGIARGDSETWRQLPAAIAAQKGFDVNRMRVMVGSQYLIGAVVIGDQTLSRPLQHLIANKADITAIRDDLLNPQANLSETLLDFWTIWRKDHATQ
ncbi:MAG: NAD(P)/FAD-dependent oxidoreductase [Chloroflexi bacterium]|jgi:NAD(P)H-nitrite reductase large subunit|nr:NAD(P)/FAD-dependent oxidoreductase [Chloroflexota bacterium]